MTEDETVHAGTETGPIHFGQRLAGSTVFTALFDEGMDLVEETANYLDGPGRRESRLLPRAGSLAYATESMRLTTRLMQLASWLLLQRAVNDGEMEPEQAAMERAKVRLERLASATEGSGWDDLPEELRRLIARSLVLQERICRLETALNQGVAPPRNNPVMQQIGRLTSAFGGG